MKEKYLRPNIVGAEMIEGVLPFIVGIGAALAAATQVTQSLTGSIPICSPPTVPQQLVGVAPRPKTKLKSLADKKIS